ncbi:hypothetical protein [Nitrincola alkalilacustris]|uniref:hypothetical protein n=1 Tax=Nitrincola alkalilacustris TaxID=1571224 RepID=UPI00124DC358|nr:hypothetical protein [Nitrincola alkalilacustris]
MSPKLPLPENKQMTALCRVEPGCLGPDGADHVEGFCLFAQQELASFESGLINWRCVPRSDKSLDEMQYSVQNKILTHEQAARYLAVFEREIDDVEDFFHTILVRLINQYLGRH